MRNPATKGKSICVAIMGIAPLLLIGTGVRAQSQPAQENRTSVQDNDTTRRELSVFNQFLDDHREIAEQLRRDPSEADNSQYLKDHPDLQTFLNDHPEIQDQLKANPAAFMRQEDIRDRGDDRGQVAEFRRFLDAHPEIAEQLRKDPSLANQAQFLNSHPALQSFLQDQPGIRQDLRQDPNAFIRQQDAFDGGDARPDDAQRAQLMEFDRFLDGHPEIAEQLRKNPSLADQPQFLKTHPALQTFLQDQPGIRQDLRQDPNAFMKQEDAFERTSRDYRQDNDNRVASFHKFLGDHRDISDQLSRNPSLVKDRDYMKDHPDLEAYLNARPDVRDGLMNNPQAFVNGSQQFDDRGSVNGGQRYDGNSGNWSDKAPAAAAPSGDSVPAPAPAPTNKNGSK
jgi:hypothetical protein